SGFDVILMRYLCQKSGYATFTSTLMSGGVLFRGFDRNQCYRRTLITNIHAGTKAVRGKGDQIAVPYLLKTSHVMWFLRRRAL
ncbi:hypothetical protein ACTXNH_11820, partial [Psychrobacter celer]|uniref:hypothetical protein n=1 Tax=Psychrobacter celer TaxID=306572 RepID=UPI003FCF5B7F